jgi:1-phosphofructokinase
MTGEGAAAAEAPGPDGRPDICVFAPWPILTVTIEAGAERGDFIHLHPGGQGVWIARMIAGLGHNVMLVGPFGHGSGDVTAALLRSEGIAVRAVRVGKRTGAYVDDRRAGKRAQIARMWPAPLDRHEMDDLFDAALTTALEAGHAVLTGCADESFFPPGAIARLARDLGAAGVDVTADLSRKALLALDHGLACLKVSHEELMDAGFARSDTEADIIAGLHALGERGRDIVVSCAGKGALARIDGRIVHASAPAMTAFDHTGAGDTMTAALAAARLEGRTADEALRFAVAAGAINVTRHGRGTGHREDIERMVERVTVRPV